MNRCLHCGSEVERASQQLKAVYERIELPPVRPQVTRVNRTEAPAASVSI